MKRKIAFFSLVTIVLAAAFFFSAGYLLELSGSSPQNADLMVVLGGGADQRVARAAELYEAGYAENILLIHERHHAGLFKGKRDVPVFHDEVSANTCSEAKSVRSFLLSGKLPVKEGSRTALDGKAGPGRKTGPVILVVTDPPHLLRVKLVFARILRNAGATVRVVSSHPQWWTPGRWWQNELSRDYVAREYAKLLYYGIRCW